MAIQLSDRYPVLHELCFLSGKGTDKDPPSVAAYLHRIYTGAIINYLVPRLGQEPVVDPDGYLDVATRIVPLGVFAGSWCGLCD
jgi:hypothetical protein